MNRDWQQTVDEELCIDLRQCSRLPIFLRCLHALKYRWSNYSFCETKSQTCINLYPIASFERQDMNIMVMIPATFTHLNGQAVQRGFLPSHGSIPGFHPSKWLWRTEAPCCKGRCSIWDPQELADIFPLRANLDHLGFAHQISMGWDVHRWG